MSQHTTIGRAADQDFRLAQVTHNMHAPYRDVEYKLLVHLQSQLPAYHATCRKKE